VINYGEPSPYSIYQEIRLELIPKNTYLDSGIWTITLLPRRVIDGTWEMWMPAAAARNYGTRFLTPSASTTLTIPSTASQVITVGAYDWATDQPASFSGRGRTWGTDQVKPDLVAPGVDITSCSPGGGYTSRTGTSMATPFVTGSCALLMQWGIQNGNDPFLYGEKLKAYLRRGARKLPAFVEYPNPQVGWGALCLKDSLP
jgi:subtilisin family serine protease